MTLFWTRGENGIHFQCPQTGLTTGQEGLFRAARFKAEQLLVNPVFIPKADIQMLIKPFRFTPAFLRCYYLKKITFRSHAGKNTKDENIF